MAIETGFLSDGYGLDSIVYLWMCVESADKNHAEILFHFHGYVVHPHLNRILLARVD